MKIDIDVTKFGYNYLDQSTIRNVYNKDTKIHGYQIIFAFMSKYDCVNFCNFLHDKLNKKSKDYSEGRIVIEIKKKELKSMFTKDILSDDFIEDDESISPHLEKGDYYVYMTVYSNCEDPIIFKYYKSLEINYLTDDQYGE